MKKFSFSLVLTFLTVFIFAQTAGDYDEILKGNFSAFVGYWVNGDGDRIYLRPDGTTYFQGQEADNFRKSTSGSYSWGVFSSGYGGFGVTIIPVGVEGHIKTDITRVRLIAGHEAPTSPEGYYYRETTFPATHIATENIRLRTDQNLSASTIKVLAKGTKVLLDKWGDEAVIDGISASWVYVFTLEGLNGWCFLGYLKDTSIQ
jgi:hypothetical protein